MRITDIETFLVFANWRNWLFARVHTDEGVYGVGEGTLEGREKTVEAAIHDLKRTVIGTDPFAIEKTWRAMYYYDSFWVGGPVLLSAIGAIEMALWDIVGKKLGVPTYNLLGGKVRDRVRLYANGWYFGAKTPDDFAVMARKLVERGFTALKWDPFAFADKTLSSRELRAALESVAAVREAVGPDVDLLIEGHGRFNGYTALQVARGIEPYNVLFFEEPIPPENFDELRDVKLASPVPIATGERCYLTYGFQELLGKRAAGIIQPDVIHCGGIFQTLKIAAMADTHYIPIAPHNPNGPVATAAALQLGACVSNFLILEYLVDDVPWREDILTAPPGIEDGHMRVPDAPGLGVDLVIEKVSEHPYKAVDISLFSPEPERNVMLRPKQSS